MTPRFVFHKLFLGELTASLASPYPAEHQVAFREVGS
jgi:hypothetical protein